VPTTPIAPTTHWTVRTIAPKCARDFILRHHYAHQGGTDRKVPGIRHCWGLLEGERLLGVVTFSNPVSYTLCRGVCGPAYKDDVLELSRLVVATPVRNAASFLIGASLRRLAKERNAIVVSYADCNAHVGHVGYVYQACNFLYTGNGSVVPKYVDAFTGETIAHTRRHIDGKERRHGPLKAVVQKGKHRYVTFVGDRRWCKRARAALRYPVLPYPKGQTRRHDGAATASQETPAAPVVDLGQIARRLNTRERRSKADMVRVAREQGEDLLKAQGECKRPGHPYYRRFLIWLNEHITEFSQGRAYHYMQFAKLIAARSFTLAEQWEEWQRISGHAQEEDPVVPKTKVTYRGSTEGDRDADRDIAPTDEDDDTCSTVYLYVSHAQGEQLRECATRLMKQYRLTSFTEVVCEAVRRWAEVPPG
jgi:hypothetical protein